MADILPPVVFLIDLSALLAGQTREWQELSRLGKCLIPQAVYQELRALSKVAIEKQSELTAREFIRFFPDSGWELSGTGATHPALVPVPGQRESKRARLALAVAECAYGISRNSPGRLVVLVSNDQALLQRLHALQATNLCGLPMSALLHWNRSGRRPPVVTHQMQMMKTPVAAGKVAAAKVDRGGVSASPTQSASTVRTVAQPAARGSRPLRPLSSAYPSSGSQIMSAVWTLIGITIAVGIVWYIFNPKSLNQFLHQLRLPTVPEISTVRDEGNADQ